MWNFSSSSSSSETETSSAAEQNCSMSTVESKNCRLEEDKNGNLVQKCEILRRVLRQCPGKPVEELESRREETINPVDSGVDSFSLQQDTNIPFPSFEEHGFGGFLSNMERMFSTVFENEFPSPGTFPERKYSDSSGIDGNKSERPELSPFSRFGFHDRLRPGPGREGRRKQKHSNLSGLGDDFQEA